RRAGIRSRVRDRRAAWGQRLRLRGLLRLERCLRHALQGGPGGATGDGVDDPGGPVLRKRDPRVLRRGRLPRPGGAGAAAADRLMLEIDPPGQEEYATWHAGYVRLAVERGGPGQIGR